MALVTCPHVTPFGPHIQAALRLHNWHCQVQLCYSTTLRHKWGRCLPFCDFPDYLDIVSSCLLHVGPCDRFSVTATWPDKATRTLSRKLTSKDLVRNVIICYVVNVDISGPEFKFFGSQSHLVRSEHARRFVLQHCQSILCFNLNVPKIWSRFSAPLRIQCYEPN
jgi:hypothetical protein